jgi:Ca2+-binding RTX toxin-like protein
LKPGFQLVANPLDNKSANGNTVSNLFATVPDGTTLYTYDAATQKFVGNGKDFGAWANDNQQLSPGGGAFLLLPAGGNVTVTAVGDVMTGALSTPIAKGFSIVSSKVPQAGKLQTDLGYTPEDGDTVYSFDVTQQKYVAAGYDFGTWSAEPSLQVGEAVFLLSPSAKSWNRTFDPNAP